MTTKPKSQKGLTLSELLLTIAIISVLISVIVISLSAYIKKFAITNDEILANRINAVLDNQKDNEPIDDNTIAILAQEEFANKITVETKKHGMNVFYNSSINKFEVLTDKLGQENNYNTLDYYMNRITFHIDKPYIYGLNSKTVNTFEGKTNTVKVSVNENDLIFAISVNEDNKIIAPEIELSELIYAKHLSTQITDLKYEIRSIDLWDEQVELGIVEPTDLRYPGKYEITVFSESYDEKFYIDLYIQNIYYSKEPAIKIINSDYTRNLSLNEDLTYDITLTTPDLLKEIQIKDYNYYHFNEDFLELSQFEEFSNIFTNNIDVFIELDENIYQIAVNSNDKKQTKLIYTATFSSINLTEDSTIKITYRYQGSNGLYYYITTEIQLNH